MAHSSTPKAAGGKPGETRRTRSRVDTQGAGHAAVWTQLPLDMEPLAHAVARGGMPAGVVPHREVPAAGVPHGEVPAGCAGIDGRGAAPLAPAASAARPGRAERA